MNTRSAWMWCSAMLLSTACSPKVNSGAPGVPGTAGTAAPSAAQPDRGAELYAQNCLPCHRENGEGVPSVYPSLAKSPAVLGDPTQLAQWVLSQKRPPTIPAGRYATQMLLFGWMKDADAAALLSYIRSHFGNSAPAIDAASVAASRARP